MSILLLDIFVEYFDRLYCTRDVYFVYCIQKFFEKGAKTSGVIKPRKGGLSWPRRVFSRVE